MSKGFWEYLLTPKQHSCELRECDVHKYFRNAFDKLQSSINKLEVHSCENMMTNLKSLADRFHFQEEWVSKLHKRIDELENQLKKDKE